MSSSSEGSSPFKRVVKAERGSKVSAKAAGKRRAALSDSEEDRSDTEEVNGQDNEQQEVVGGQRKRPRIVAGSQAEEDDAEAADPVFKRVTPLMRDVSG